MSNLKLMSLATTEAHRTLSCGLGIDAYIAQVNLSGFSSKGLRSRIQEEIESCVDCETSRMIMTAKSSLTKQLTKDMGPDDFYQNITAKDMFGCIIVNHFSSRKEQPFNEHM